MDATIVGTKFLVRFKNCLRPTQTIDVDEEDIGSESVKDSLTEAGIKEKDVFLVSPMSLFMEDDNMSQMVMRLVHTMNGSIILKVSPAGKADSVYLIAEDATKGLLEFNVCDGMPGDRSEALNFYSFSEAMKVFNSIAKKGWRMGTKAKRA